MDIADMEKLLFAEWDRICGEEQARGFADVSHADQVFHRIWMLEAELNNGGFSQYMFNSSGDHALSAVDALREVGADDLAAICQSFFALLRGGAPAADQDLRQGQLDEVAERMGEDAFEEACSKLQAEFCAGEDELRRQLVRYIREARTL
jgi:hypothetical protein